MFRTMPWLMLQTCAKAVTAVAAEPPAAPAATDSATAPAIELLQQEGVIHRDLAARVATAASTSGATRPCSETGKPKAAAGEQEASAKPACTPRR